MNTAQPQMVVIYPPFLAKSPRNLIFKDDFNGNLQEKKKNSANIIRSDQSLSRVRLFATP